MLFFENSDLKASEKIAKAKKHFCNCVEKLQTDFEPMDVVAMLQSHENRVCQEQRAQELLQVCFAESYTSNALFGYFWLSKGKCWG